jgi:hypothetical protein
MKQEKQFMHKLRWHRTSQLESTITSCEGSKTTNWKSQVERNYIPVGLLGLDLPDLAASILPAIVLATLPTFFCFCAVYFGATVILT